MSENEKTVPSPEGQAEETSTGTTAKTPMDAAEMVSRGRFKLAVPIEDGEQKYEELIYDFNKLTGWELARAMDDGADRNRNGSNINDRQALTLFATAAAKCTGGLDATDIRDRLSITDAITAISVASIFFRGTLLAGSLRITKE